MIPSFYPAIPLPESSANNPNAHYEGSVSKAHLHHGLATRKNLVALNVKEAPSTSVDEEGKL